MSKRLMDWIAVYENGETLKEDRNEFKDIDNDKLNKFILKGCDSKFTHLVNTGECLINDNRFLFMFNDRLLGKSKDVINFKEAVNAWKGESYIIGYYTGWKEKDEMNNNIELLFWVDILDKKIKIRFSFVPQKEENILSMVVNGSIKNIKIKSDKIGQKNTFVVNLQ